MTRRIKRQRHRRRRTGSAHDPVDASRVDQDPQSEETQSEETQSEETRTEDEEESLEVVGESVSQQSLLDDEGSGDESNMDEDADGDVGAEDAVDLEKDDRSAADLEDTAADPALEGGAEPRHARSRVERPDTDGAPVLEDAVQEPTRVHEDPDHPEAFGRWLRSQRELRGIHLRAIAESSKISLGHLKALESGRFDLLPADVFTKGFLRQYSGYVGLDPEEAINFYLAARDHVEEEEDPLGTPPPPRESGMRWVVVALILAVVLLGVIWGLQRMSESSDGAAPAPTQATVPAATDESPDPPPDSASPSASPADGAATDSPDAPADSSAAGTPEDPAAEPTQDPSVVQPSQPTAPAQSVQPANVPLRIVLDFSDTCWVSALIDGTETREKVHAQGESLTLDARSSVELKVGNYRAVEVEVNGMPYDLGSRGRSGSVVRTVLIDLESVRELRSEIGTTG